MTIVVEVATAGSSARKIGDYEFEVCPRLGEIVQVASASGDLEFMKVVRIEHQGIELPRSFFSEGKRPLVVVYVERESRYSGRP